MEPARSLSIIIPCFKQGHYLAGCVNSVLSQCRDSFCVQIVVVNDGSPDDTEEIARAFGTQIDYVRQENKGLAGARNTGITMATGEWILFLDCDDRLAPGALSALSAAIEEQPDARAYCGGSIFINDDGVALETKPAPVFEPDAFHALYAGNVSPTFGFLVRAEDVRKAGLFDPDPRLFGHEDWNLWLKIALMGGEFVRLSSVVGLYRRSLNSMSFVSASRMNDSGEYVARKYQNVHPHCSICAVHTTHHLGLRAQNRALWTLLDGRRIAALGAFVRGLRPLLADRRMRFAITFPLLLLMPKRLLLARWPLERRGI